MKFVQDAKLYPGRYDRNPSDVIGDRHLTKEGRLEIVIASEHDTRCRLEAADADDSAVQEKLQQLEKLYED